MTPPAGEQVPTTMAWFREGVNWIVALSASILVFGVGFYKEFASASWFVKTPFVSAALLFFITIVLGVLCYFWINSYANAYENLTFYEKELKQNAANVKEAQELKYETKKAETAMESARRKYGAYFKGLMWAFCLGMFALALLLVAGATWGSPPAAPREEKPGKNQYIIAIAAMHMSAKGKQHTHTFLVNQSTGAVWLMVCSGQSSVRFQKVDVESLTFTPKLPVP